ncbi:YciI family protein [Leifsonia sp. NPDC058230]|uniref:YciI family protein n=1 Tax=Leifsonia sp. NPDC058230 TaxID=3346391 RepID=UPI0036DBE26E
MRFQILIYNNAEFDMALRNGLMEELDSTHRAVIEELTASGELVDSDELSTTAAATVRVDPGTRMVLAVDGPFCESKEWVGGYYVVDVAGIDRAVEIAGRFVEARFSPIEVRQLVHAGNAVSGSVATASPSV